MGKSMLIGLVAAALLLLLVGFTWRNRQANRQAIAAAEVQAAQLEAERNSLMGEVETRQAQHAALARERVVYEQQAASLRDSVDQLEQRRAEAQRNVREIRTVGELQDRLLGAFPEWGGAAWGLTTVHVDDADTLGLEYLMVPAWFAESFAIDRANARSWEMQKHRLLETDSLRIVVAVLQDSVIRLEEANAEAYRSGYWSAYEGYQELNRRYLAELKKPRIEIKTPIGVIGAAGLGIVIGRALP